MTLGTYRVITLRDLWIIRRRDFVVSIASYYFISFLIAYFILSRIIAYWKNIIISRGNNYLALSRRLRIVSSQQTVVLFDNWPYSSVRVLTNLMLRIFRCGDLFCCNVFSMSADLFADSSHHCYYYTIVASFVLDSGTYCALLWVTSEWISVGIQQLSCVVFIPEFFYFPFGTFIFSFILSQWFYHVLEMFS